MHRHMISKFFFMISSVSTLALVCPYSHWAKLSPTLALEMPMSLTSMTQGVRQPIHAEH